MLNQASRPNPAYQALLYRQWCLIKQIREKKKQLGLEFYSPHKYQELFHRMGHKKSRLAEAGNRSGKSEMGVAEDASWLRGERPFFAKSDPDRYKGIPQGRPTKGIVIANNWKKVEEVFVSYETGKLWKYLPRGFAKAVRGRSGYVEKVICENGSSLWFTTCHGFANDPLSDESSQWDFVHIDEPCSEAQYKAVARGLMDTFGSEWFTLTPLDEPWIHYRFFPSRSFEDDATISEPDEFRWAVRFSIYDNPHIHPDAIRKFESELTEDEKEARLYGVPLAMSGIVYKEFRYGQHVLDELPPRWLDYHMPPEDHTIYFSLDPHPRTPHACLFQAVGKDGYVYNYDEIWRACTYNQIANEIVSKLHNRFVGLGMVDPSAFNKDANHRTMADHFAEEGLYLGVAPKQLEHGIIATKKKLNDRDNYGKPTMRFSPRLKRTLAEFDLYVWDKEKNKPKDESDHMMECLYRLVLINPKYIEMNKESNGPVEDLDITSTPFNFGAVLGDDKDFGSLDSKGFGSLDLD